MKKFKAKMIIKIGCLLLLVYSANEEMKISPLYGEYKKLLQLIIDRCDEKVLIESNIYEHL